MPRQINSGWGRTVMGNKPFLKKAAGAIVAGRYLIFLIFAAACVYCALSVGRVKTNPDLAAFLPEDTETRKALTVMEKEFEDFETVSVMLSGVSYEEAEAVRGELLDLPGVTDVAFDGSGAHYKNGAALLTVSFDGSADPEAMEKIRALSARFDTAVAADVISDYSAKLAQEMGGVILLAAAVIVAVLLVTSRSYFETVIFFVVFAVAALLNMGTNFWLGTISSITNSVGVILQLALAIDYAIILARRCQDEAARGFSLREALPEALAGSVVEVASSSLTTVAGLAALTLMQFRLGYDLGIVLAKGIFCSLITVLCLMPGLLYVFARPLEKLAHRSFMPDMRAWGRFLVRSKGVFVILFLLLLPAAFLASRNVRYAFTDTGVSEIIPNENRAARRRVAETFDPDSMVAVIVPAGDPAAERAFLAEAAGLPEVKSVTGLAAIEAEPGHALTDEYTPQMFARFLNIDEEQAGQLFQAYGVRHGKIRDLFSGTADDGVPLVDLLLFAFDLADSGLISLTGEQKEQMEAVRGQLERGAAQLKGKHYDRMIVRTSLPAEGGESVAFVEKLRDIAAASYRREDILIAGYITSARDLKASFTSDMLKISFLTIGFVFLILLLTFRSFVGALTLVFVIQGSIWINFACTRLAGSSPSFVTNMIVTAIQMGATIDYAIVIMNRYLNLRGSLPKKEAMTEAVNQSFPTVMTSGTILTVAGLLIAFRVSDVYIGHIGLAVGRGALISVILVLTVLPQMILLLDGAIGKTTFTVKRRRSGEQ